MIDFNQIAENKIQVKISANVFNEVVITKTLYWLQNNYFVFWNQDDNIIQNIILEKKNGLITDEEFFKIKDQLNQDLIDFKTRDIITQETKNIRDILYIKAFANGEDFEDYNLMDSQNV
jgi:His-Xaa-Ser system protein HxsD